MRGMKEAVKAYLTGRLLYLWDTEFYSDSKHALFGFDWQICGALFDWSGSVVDEGLPESACVLRKFMSREAAEPHRAAIQAF